MEYGMATLLLASNGLWMTTEFIVILPHKPLVDVLLASLFFFGGGGGEMNEKIHCKERHQLLASSGLLIHK